MGKVLFGTTIPDARDVPYNNTVSLLTATNTQSAIDELNVLISGSSRAFTFAQYNGNGNPGRYLEWWLGIASNIAPISVVGPLKVLAMFTRTTAANATCTIGYYNVAAGLPGTLLYTETLTAQKQKFTTGTTAVPIFTLPANGSLAVRVDSGSINTPHLYITGQGG